MFARAFTWRLSSAACRPAFESVSGFFLGSRLGWAGLERYVVHVRAFADARANALAAASRNRSRLKQSRRVEGAARECGTKLDVRNPAAWYFVRFGIVACALGRQIG